MTQNHKYEMTIKNEIVLKLSDRLQHVYLSINDAENHAIAVGTEPAASHRPGPRGCIVGSLTGCSMRFCGYFRCIY